MNNRFRITEDFAYWAWDALRDDNHAPAVYILNEAPRSAVGRTIYVDLDRPGVFDEMVSLAEYWVAMANAVDPEEMGKIRYARSLLKRLYLARA